MLSDVAIAAVFFCAGIAAGQWLVVWRFRRRTEPRKSIRVRIGGGLQPPSTAELTDRTRGSDLPVFEASAESLEALGVNGYLTMVAMHGRHEWELGQRAVVNGRRFRLVKKWLKDDRLRSMEWAADPFQPGEGDRFLRWLRRNQDRTREILGNEAEGGGCMVSD